MSPERRARRLLGKAVHAYDLIGDGDRIAVAVSGGKDSLLLVRLLKECLRYAPVEFRLKAVHVDPGFDGETASRVKDFLESEGIDHEVLSTDYGVRAHDPKNRQNPCFACSRWRRGALFREARRTGCRKIALGHNQDDFIETFLVNVFYSGQVAAMLPRQPFFQGGLEVIRPLALMPSDLVERAARKLGLPVIENPCPSASRSQRTRMRRRLEALYRENPKVRGNLFRAMSNVRPEYLPPPFIQGKSKP